MRVVVFGAGYVGGAFAQAALERGWEVRAVSRNGEALEPLRAAGVRCLRADLVDDSWEEALAGDFDLALSCVSAGRRSNGHEHSYHRSTQRLLNWAEGRRIGRWVYTGSTSVYPDADGEWVDEDHSLAEPSSEAARALQTAERLFSGLEAKGVPWNVLRLAGIYGPGRHLLLNQLRQGASALPGWGDVYLNLIHRDDIVGALLALAERSEMFPTGIFNLSDGSPALKTEIVEWLAGETGMPVPRFDPQLPGKRRHSLTGRPPHRRIAPFRLFSALGWRPVHGDFRIGYRAILDRLRGENWLPGRDSNPD
jgi:nucleoside-diphosphate-sugar epimerase